MKISFLSAELGLLSLKPFPFVWLSLSLLLENDLCKVN